MISRYRTKFVNSTAAKFFVTLYALTFLVMVILTRIRNDQKPLQRQILKDQNVYRVAQAKATLNKTKPLFDNSGILLSSANKGFGALNNSSATSSRNDHSCSLAISIITVSRSGNLTDADEPLYIIQSVAAFLQLFKQSYTDDIHIHFSVCNVDIDPESHTDMRYIPKWITVFQREAKKRKRYKSFYAKENEDYIFCLRKTLEQNTSHILLVEDDALPLSELFTVMKKIVLTKDKCVVKERNPQNVLYIKLYTRVSDKGFIRTWLGTSLWYPFGFDVGKLSELITIALILTGLVFLLSRRNRKTTLPWYYFVILFIYIAFIVNVVGRQNIRIVWRYILGITHELSSAPAGVTAALLFPRDGAESSVRYLNSIKSTSTFAKDIALNALGRQHRKQLLYIEPSLFQHIGYRSSKGNTGF